MRSRGVERKGNGQTDLPAMEEAEFMGKAGDEGGMFFRMQNREGMIPEGENGGGGGEVGDGSSENDPLMAEVEAVEKAKGKVSDGVPQGGWGKRVGLIHVRRMREISGKEMRWRAR